VNAPPPPRPGPPPREGGRGGGGLAFGVAGPPGAPALLLVHGFLGSRRDWEPVVAALAGTARCIAVDLPGHGATGDPGDDALWSLPGCADRLARLLGEVAPGGAVVAGYSLGGRVALHLATRHPSRLRAAAIISASPGLADPVGRAARRGDDERLARRLEGEGLAAFLEGWYDAPLFAPLRERPGFAGVLARRRGNDAALLARSLRTMGLGAQEPLQRALPALGLPLLFLAGERDPKFAAIARDAAAACPAGEARVLAGAGHALVEEEPGEVAAALAGLLARG